MVIGANAQMLDKRVTDPAARKCLARMLRAVSRAETVTRQLLSISRKQPLEPRTLNLGDLVITASELLRPMLGESIELAVKGNSNAGAYVWVDPVLLKQAILNLAVNARDAMSSRGRLEIEVHSETVEDSASPLYVTGDCVVLSVSDTGKGMDPNTTRQVFEPFFTTKRNGTGLGLAMIYGMVKQSGGDIFVESEEGRGTTFRLYFPRVAPPVTTEPEPSAKDEYSIAGVATVLLVEDEDDLRLLLRDFLHECGYRVLTAESGEAALRLAESHEGEIDVLLSDIILTDTNGYDLAKELEPVAPGVKLNIYVGVYGGGNR